MIAVPIFEDWVWPAQFEFEMNEGSNLESKIELNLAMERFCDARLFHCVGIKRNVGSVNSKQNRNVADLQCTQKSTNLHNANSSLITVTNKS